LIHQRHRITVITYFISDLLATLAAFFVAWYLRFGTGLFPSMRH